MKQNELKGSKSVAVLSANPDAALQAIIYLINKGIIVIPLDNLLSGRKIASYLEAVGCSEIVTDGNLPSDFDYNCRISNISEIDSDEKSGMNSHIIRDIFYDFESARHRKTTIIFTSGSTNTPKAVLHTLENHYYSSLGSNENIKFEKEDKWLIVLPLYHISGISVIFRAALSGGKIAIKEKEMDIAEALRRNKPTHISLVPHQLNQLLDDGKNIDILRKMKAILLGGAGVPVHLIEQSFEYGLNLFVSYGSTEMCSQITCTKSRDTLKHLRTSGCLLGYREIKINEKGNILVKGKTLFAGYIIRNDQDNNLMLKRELDNEGYFNTGDNGFLDYEGYLHVAGRKDTSFKFKAEKIYPEEIEKIFSKIKGVHEAIVVPYKKNDYEKIPVIFLKIDDQGKENFKFIKEKAKEELEPYKFPRYFLKWPYNFHVLKPPRKEMEKTAQEIIRNALNEKMFD